MPKFIKLGGAVFDADRIEAVTLNPPEVLLRDRASMTVGEITTEELDALVHYDRLETTSRSPKNTSELGET